MKRLIILSALFAFSSAAHAEPVAVCEGSQYKGCYEIGNTSKWLYDPNDYTTVKEGFIYQPDGCKSLLPGIPIRHKICRDTNSDSIADIVEEMTQSEKDAVDAPWFAEEARQAEFDAELSTNDVCDKELSVIENYLDGRLVVAQNQLDSSNNVNQIKDHMRNQLYPELISLFKKVARCTRARAR